MVFNMFSPNSNSRYQIGENQQNRLPPHQLLPVHAKVTLHTPQHQSLNNSIHALDTTLALEGRRGEEGEEGEGEGEEEQENEEAGDTSIPLIVHLHSVHQHSTELSHKHRVYIHTMNAPTYVHTYIVCSSRPGAASVHYSMY